MNGEVHRALQGVDRGSWPVRLYALALSLFPVTHDADDDDDDDDALRDDAVDTFVDLLRAARRAGPVVGRWRALHLTARCVALAVGAACAERRAERAALRGQLHRTDARRSVEHVPQTSLGDPMDIWRHDVVTAFRSFRNRPGFVFASIAILALGIAASTTLFSVVDGVLLRPLPYADAERLVYFDEGSHAVPLFALWKELSTIENPVGAFVRHEVLTGTQEPARVRDAQITDGFLTTFGARPAAGRLLQDEDFAQRAPVVLISERLWQTRWGSDADLVGSQIVLDGADYTVVGVVSADFQMPEVVDGDVDVWRPFAPTAEMEESWNFALLTVVGRLAPGVDLQAAQDEVRAIDLRIADEFPEQRLDRSGNPYLTPVVGLREATVHHVGERLWVLLFAGFAVLLVGCANVASLSLARGRERLHELAVRKALGAGRLRLVRQLLVENVLLALAGGAAGVGLAFAGLRGFLALQPGDLPRLAEVTIDPRILAAAVAATLVCGLLCGVAPALQAARPDLERVLRSASPGAVRRDGRGRSLFVVFEVALSLVLLAAAGLLLHSLMLRFQQDPGLETERLVRMPLQLPSNLFDRSPEAMQKRVATVTALVETIETMPEIESAAVTWAAPFTYFGGNSCCWRSRLTQTTDSEVGPLSLIHPVTDGYLDVLGAEMLAGRGIDPGDAQLEPAPLVVNRHLALELLAELDEGVEIPEAGDEGPSRAETVTRMAAEVETERLARLLGRTWYLYGNSTTMQIVGIVDDIYEWGPSTTTRPVAYTAYGRFGGTIGLASMLVRTRVDVDLGADSGLAERMRDAVWSVDPAIPVPIVESMEARREAAFAEPRFYTVLLGLFAGVSLLLAAAGLFASLHQVVSSRRREIGVRVALGAQSGQVLALVLRQGLVWLTSGLALGWLASAAVGGALRSQLFGIGAADPRTVVSVSAVLLFAGLAACWLPARRAARLDPMETLRAD